jgi:antitoxin VapB
MQTAKLFINGRSQAVRLPKDDPWSPLINSLDQFTDDFMDSRDQPNQNSREKL